MAKQRCPIAMMTVYKNHVQFNVEAIDHLPKDVMVGAYVAISHDITKTLLKITFHTTYVEGDTTTTKNRSVYQLNSGAVYPLLQGIKKAELFQSKIDPYVWYAHLGVILPPEIRSLITAWTTIPDSDMLDWTKLSAIVRNKHINVLQLTIATNIRKGSPYHIGHLNIRTYQHEYYQHMLFASSVYFEYDPTLQKVCIKMNHPMGYGHTYITHAHGIRYYISLDQLNRIFPCYGVDLISPEQQYNEIPYYWKVIPHPTEDGVYVIDAIYTSRACMIDADTCDD